MKRLIATLVLLLAAWAAPSAEATAVGEAAPPLSLPDGAGAQVSLEGLRGKVVYVDFWASWCAPCKRSFPWMNAMQQKYGADGFTIVAVNVDKKRTDADRFLARVPADFKVVFDPAGASPAAWQVKSMPSSYVVDAAGRVVMVEHGFREERAAEVEERIRTALKAR